MSKLHLLDRDVLVLSSAWVPVNIVKVPEAISKLFGEQAQVLCSDTMRTFKFEEWAEEYADHDDVISSPTIKFRIPEIIITKADNKHCTKPRMARYSKENLFHRDNGHCVYCNMKLTQHGKGYDRATVDHIIPRDKGGKTVWANVALACQPCNLQKGNKLLAESGLSFFNKEFKPGTPNAALLFKHKMSVKRYPKSWEYFFKNN